MLTEKRVAKLREMATLLYCPKGEGKNRKQGAKAGRQQLLKSTRKTTAMFCKI
jgi:hypothetical protein